MARQFCFLSFLSFRKSTAVATAFWRSLSLYWDSLWQETITGMDTVLCSSCPHRRAAHCFMNLEQVTPHRQRSLFAHWASRTECVPLSKRVLLLATLASYSGHILGSLSGVSFVTGKAICNLHRWLELCHRWTFCPRALLQSPMKPWGAKVSWTSSLWTCKSHPPRPSPGPPPPGDKENTECWDTHEPHFCLSTSFMLGFPLAWGATAWQQSNVCACMMSRD